MNNDHEFHELNELTMQNDMIMTNLTNAFVKFVINMVSVRTPKIL